MNGWKRTGLAILILGVAVLAALPFLRTADSNSTAEAWKPGGGSNSPRLVPLQVEAHARVSPALALYEEEDSPAPPAGQVRQPVIRREAGVELIANLDPIVPVPELPRHYQPSWLSPDVRPLDPVTGPRETRPGTVRHRIADGDTLPALAERYLGDPRQDMRIFEANRQVLSAPDVLPVGVEIVIPLGPESLRPEPSAARQSGGARR